MMTRDGEPFDFGCRCESPCPNPACQMAQDLLEREMFRQWSREQVRRAHDAEVAHWSRTLDGDDQALEVWAAAADTYSDEMRDHARG